jgi:hypothetical protein
VSKQLNSRTDAGAKRQSRIRREPVSPQKPASLEKALWQSREWEIGIAVIGMILFALAISSVSIGFSAITG